MPRYYFAVRWTHREDEDPQGTLLSDDAAALENAARLIQQLKVAGRHSDPGLMVVVRDEAHKVVLSVPFHAACA